MALDPFLASLLPLMSDDKTLHVLQSLAIVVGAGWVLWSFRKSNRIKAIETLISLEGEFRQHISLLTKIEERDPGVIEPLKKEAENRKAEENKRPSIPLTKGEHQTITDIDRLLRHLLICYQTKRFGIDGGALDSMYKYYLTVLCSDEQSELKEYISHYYKTLFNWSCALNNRCHCQSFRFLNIPAGKCKNRPRTPN